jgi:hypothetical protein
MPLSSSFIHPTQQRAASPAFPNGSMRAGTYTLVFQIRDAQSKVLLKKHQLILFPAILDEETEVRTTLYYTKKRIVADTPAETGIGVTIFTIRGHTGYAGIPMEGAQPLVDRLSSPVTVESFVQTVQSVALHVGQNHPVRGSLIDGSAAIKDLQDTIEAYFFPSGQPETSGVPQTSDLQLEFLNLSAPVSAQDQTGRVGWIIHPHRNLVNLHQEASKPFLYFYTFQFAAIAPLDVPVADDILENYTKPQNLRSTLARISAVVRDLTNGVNTIRDAAEQLVMQNVTGPISTLLLNSAHLADAVQGFADSAVAVIQFPLYAARLLTQVLEAPAHSVSTLGQAAHELVNLFTGASLARSVSIPFAGFSLTSGTNDQLMLQLNEEEPITLLLGTQASGESVAATIQAQVRAQTPQHTANLAAYREFTATYTDGQYTLTSGTFLSDAARVNVIVDADPILTPTDASPLLGLGTRNGGQEHAGTTVAVRAIGLLQGLESACRHLQAFPDYFAAQLADQDAQLRMAQPLELVRAQIRGDQHLFPMRITPGDTLPAMASRVGLPWETLALVNNLTYPYILQEPSTLLQSRVSSADRYSLTDTRYVWATNVWQGQRLDTVSGPGAGQSRLILRNTSTTLFIDQGWALLPNDTTEYAIRSATNPIVQTGTITSVTARTLTDSALNVVPDSQRGYTVMVATDPTTGERRRIVEHSQDTYVLDAPWEALPAVGAIYLILLPARHGVSHQRLLGETISVPRPRPIRGRRGVRSPLEDVSTITGELLSRETQLFGRDWRLQDGVLSWDPTRQDCETVEGLANLRQAVVNLINVPLGQVEYAAGLGSYVQETLGRPATLASQVELLQSVQRTVKQDPRIARLVDTQMFTQGGHTSLALAVQAISGDTIDRIVIS